MFYKFLWNSGPDRISQSNMIKNETCGGLRMVKLDSFIKALKVTWVRRFLLNSQNPIWSSLSNIDFSKLLSMGDGYPTQVIHKKNLLDRYFTRLE